MKAYCLWICCLLCCAVALGACGGDSDGGATANPGSQATTTEGSTEDSGSQGEAGEATGGSGPEIPPEIETAVFDGITEGGYSAQLTEVEDVEVDGAEATAEVVLSGGGLDGQSVEVVLSKAGGDWKLDEITEFTEFDKAQMVKSYEDETKELPENFSPKIVRCLTGQFSSSSQAKIEAMYLDQNRQLFVELGRPCLGN